MKFRKLLLLFIISLLLISCSSDPRYINFKTKPNNNYYTNELYKKLKNNEDVSIRIFDNNSYEYYEVEEKEEIFLPDFITFLDTDYFGVEIPSNKDPRYKLIISFADTQYGINIYDDKLITVYPWDGVFPSDTISMEKVPVYYNLYEFCDYTTKKALGQLP